MKFVVIGAIEKIEVIARGRGVRARRRLNKEHGSGWWRKLTGVATVEFVNGMTRRVELHWFEAHGVGRRELKIKRVLT